MRILRTILAVAFIAASSTSLFAQHGEKGCEAQKLGYKPYPYWFVQVQGGVNTTFTNVKFTDLLNPTASFGVGRWFKPAVGARLHVNGWESKGGFGNGLKYKYNYLTTDADLLINLNHLFAKSQCNNLFNVIFVGGFGLNYSWDNDELQGILAGNNVPLEDTSNAWGKGTTRKQLFSHNLRAGLLFDFNVAKHWNIGVEVDANSLDDRFNSKYSNKDDWMVTAQLGITYKFGQKKVEPKPEPKPVVLPPAPKPEPKPVVTPPAPPAPKKVFKPYGSEIYFEETKHEIRDEYKSIVPSAAAWCKENPDKKILVEGYADKDTGWPDKNMIYSQNRAEEVAKQLKANGVPEDQIIIKWYGDTVQPREGIQNRVVIISGK